MTPPTVPSPCLGISCNLYTVRSDRNLGIGDLGDLATLIDWIATQGGDFVAVNPLFASASSGRYVGPYAPSTRHAFDDLYLDLHALPPPEIAPIRTWLESHQEDIETLRQASHLNRPALRTAKRMAARTAFTHTDRDALDTFRRNNSISAAFAIFQTLSDHHGDDHGFSTWPRDLRDPNHKAVAAFAAAHADDVDFHLWMQMRTLEQLAALQARASDRGLSIGLIHDLPIGVNPFGFDVWFWPDHFRRDRTLGCPPDAFNPDGQAWDLAPFDPETLTATNASHLVAIADRILPLGGALRIDHVLGLQRIWLIPTGATPNDGSYHAMPLDLLLSTIADRATHHDALIIGEDLGTVDPKLPPRLHQAGFLGTDVGLLLIDPEHGLPSHQHLRTDAFFSLTTHDLPPLASWLAATDILIRHDLGHPPLSLQPALNERHQRITALCQSLVDASLLDPEVLVALGDVPNPGTAPVLPHQQRPIIDALHRWALASPAQLIALPLDDLLVETIPINFPGIAPEVWPSFTRRMERPLSELAGIDLRTLKNAGTVPSR